ERIENPENHEDHPMKITDAERVIRGGTDRYEELEAAKTTIREELDKIGANNHAVRARLYYELVRCTLAQDHSSENGVLTNEFSGFRHELQREEQRFVRKRQTVEGTEARTNLKNAFITFCRSSERSMASLEVFFRRHSFQEKEQEAYLEKMRYLL